MTYRSVCHLLNPPLRVGILGGIGVLGRGKPPPGGLQDAQIFLDHWHCLEEYETPE